MLNKLSTLRTRGVSEEGFTLIELIIVVVIIGILAAIAIPIFLNQQKAAIAAGVKSDVKNTHTNVATFLVKTPTAADLSTVEVVESDAATTVTVAGGWEDYTVSGANTGLDGTYEFDSATGKYAGTGADF